MPPLSSQIIAHDNDASPFLNMPLDLMHKILEQLPTRADRYNVIQTCRALYSIGIEHLWKYCTNLQENALLQTRSSPWSLPPTSLWPLLRSLLHNPKLGEMIKEIHWQSPHDTKPYGLRVPPGNGLLNDLFPKDGRRNPKEPSDTDLALLKYSVRQMGIAVDRRLLNEMRSGDNLTLFLVLLRTPRLCVLNLVGTWLHLSIWRDVTHSINNQLAANTLPFTHLPDLHTYADHGFFPNVIPNIHRILSQPKIRSVTLNLGGPQPLLPNGWHDLATDLYDLDDLTIISNTMDNTPWPWETRALISSCKALKSLTLENVSNATALEMKRSPSGLHDLLSSQESTLQSFAINHTAVLMRTAGGWTDLILAKAQPLSFANFTNLRCLKVYLPLLVNIKEDLQRDRDVDQFVSKLPPTLRYLSVIVTRSPRPDYLPTFIRCKVPNFSPQICNETACLRHFSIEIPIYHQLDMAATNNIATIRRIVTRILHEDSFNFEVLGDFYGETVSFFKSVGFSQNADAFHDGVKAVMDRGGMATLSISPVAEWYGQKSLT